jgi:hypothetical protein
VAEATEGQGSELLTPDPSFSLYGMTMQEGVSRLVSVKFHGEAASAA